MTRSDAWTIALNSLMDRSIPRFAAPCEDTSTAGVGGFRLTETRQRSSLILGPARLFPNAGKDGMAAGFWNALYEVTCFRETPASATLVADQPSRLFTVDASKLRALARSDAELGLCLQQSIMRDARAKLASANASPTAMRSMAS